MRSTNRKQRFMLLVLAATAALAGAVSMHDSAQAVEPRRTTLPITAGTELDFPAGYCTAGLVLKSNSWSSLTSYSRAVRYVLTAGHCGNVGDAVSVGGTGVGAVSWKSSRSDLLIVKVEPWSTRRQTCSVSHSAGPRCTIFVDYSPKATGTVKMSTGTLPVTGMGGSPAANEVFCTSGKNTNVMCDWHNFDGSRFQGQIPTNEQGIRFAESTRANVVSGDSGGPVLSRDRHVYGITARAANPTSPWPNVMTYTSIDQFLSEQNGYALAPPN